MMFEDTLNELHEEYKALENKISELKKENECMRKKLVSLGYHQCPKCGIWGDDEECWVSLGQCVYCWEKA